MTLSHQSPISTTIHNLTNYKSINNNTLHNLLLYKLMKITEVFIKKQINGLNLKKTQKISMISYTLKKHTSSKMTLKIKTYLTNKSKQPKTIITHTSTTQQNPQLKQPSINQIHGQENMKSSQPKLQSLFLYV